MKLTGPEIHRQIQLGLIKIDPYIPEHMGPNSYDLRLSPDLLVYSTKPRIGKPGEQSFNFPMDMDNLVDQDRSDQNEEFEFWHPLELRASWNNVLDMAVNTPTYRLQIPETGLVLLPGRLYIGSTVEHTETPHHVPCIEGRSSVGRLGINIHSTAGFGDIGFKGTWTLEISVIEPVRVYPNVRIAQIYYETVTGDIKPYASDKYQGQRGPKPSGLWKELQRETGRTTSTPQESPERPASGS